MTTRWKPDTCKCVLEYDGIDENGDYINPVLVAQCDEHKALGHSGVHAFHRSKEDNQLKNVSIAALEELGHNPTEIDFAYDKDFNLSLKLPSRESTARKITALNHLKSKFTKAQSDRIKVE